MDTPQHAKDQPMSIGPSPNERCGWQADAGRVRPRTAGAGWRRRSWIAIALWMLAVAPAWALETMMTGQAQGGFTVAMRPLELEGADNARRGRMVIDKRITGDLVATTRGQMLTAMTGVEGSAVYVAVEEVTGTLAGRSGSFMLHHRGVMARGAQELSVLVVPDSGTGELTGIAGEFRIRVVGGRHHYTFSYSLPGGE